MRAKIVWREYSADHAQIGPVHPLDALRDVVHAGAARLNGMSTRMVGTDTNLYQSRVAEASRAYSAR